METTLASNFYKKTTADATFYNKTNVDLLLNGKQDALTRVVDINAASLLSSQNIVKALTTTSPLTYTDVNDKVTVALNQTALETTLATNFYNKTTADSTFYNKTSVNGLLALKQDALIPAAATGAAQVLSDLNVVKCLTTTSPVTFTDVNDKITIGLDMSAMPSTLTNPYWIAGQIGADGVTVSKRNGRYTFTSQLTSATQFLVTMSTPHPSGTDYIVQLTAQGDVGRVYIGTSFTSTQFRINWGSTAAPVYVAVLAPLPYQLDHLTVQVPSYHQIHI